MTVTKQDMDAAALAHLAEAFPRTFVLEKYRPHRPLKVGIAADIPARCLAVERRVLSAALSVYARRVMYLQGMVAGTARVDLDGKEAGEVTARDAEYAAAKRSWRRAKPSGPRLWKPRSRHRCRRQRR